MMTFNSYELVLVIFAAEKRLYYQLTSIVRGENTEQVYSSAYTEI